MDLHLKDKVIIVTGGAGLPGSIGETIVRSIAGEDGIPVIIDKDQRGKHLQHLLRKMARTVFLYRQILRNLTIVRKQLRRHFQRMIELMDW